MQTNEGRTHYHVSGRKTRNQSYWLVIRSFSPLGSSGLRRSSRRGMGSFSGASLSYHLRHSPCACSISVFRSPILSSSDWQIWCTFIQALRESEAQHRELSIQEDNFKGGIT